MTDDFNKLAPEAVSALLQVPLIGPMLNLVETEAMQRRSIAWPPPSACQGAAAKSWPTESAERPGPWTG